MANNKKNRTTKTCANQLVRLVFANEDRLNNKHPSLHDTGFRARVVDRPPFLEQPLSGQAVRFRELPCNMPFHVSRVLNLDL